MARFVSIGIPARNESESIETAIRSLVASAVWRKANPFNRELIVCLNGCTDKGATEAVVRKLQAEIPQIKILIEGAIGKNAAINKIVAA